MTKFLNISTDNTLGGNSPSNELVASQKAIKEYVDNKSVDIDNSTITKNSSDELQAVATVNANTAAGATNPVYDWVGTLQEYIDQDIETLHPDWICYITDDVNGGTSVYTKTQVDNLLATVVPAGLIAAYGVSTAPTGWLKCDGSAVSRTTYASLFAVIGTTYGSGDGSTTFNLPNMSSWYMLSGGITVASNGNLVFTANGVNRTVQWLDGKITTNPAINQGVMGLSGNIPNSKTLYNLQYASGLKNTATTHSLNFFIKY